MRKIQCIQIESGHGLSNYYPKILNVKDDGAVSSGYTEYSITSAVAQKVCEILRSKEELAGVLIQGIGFASRARIQDKVKFANSVVSENKFDPERVLFVSIHCNSNAGVAGTGIEIWLGDGKEKNREFATSVINSMIEYSGLKNRGLKTRSLYHQQVNANSILVELGFLNNQSDRKFLLDTQRVATALSHGILEHIRQ
jgi:N-acetylmuramoyl-L-alanine amidase